MGQSIEQAVLVGHCGADRMMLERVVFDVLGADFPVYAANDTAQLDRFASSRSLLLVNRQLDGRFATGSGIELIRDLARQPDPPVAMLISNYDDAQQQAIEAGGARGFGKSHLHDPRTAAILRQAASGTGPINQSAPPTTAS